MRPLFGSMLVPSTPMNEDRLTTSGSFKMTLRQGLLPLRHGGKRKRCRGFRDAQENPGILHREKALGNDQEQENRESQSPEGHDQRGG
jgi:hypothetical protein